MSKIVLLDSLRSLQNVGAIFRNADGSGFEKIIMCGTTPTPPRNDISKTALGSEKTIDWEYFSDAMEALQALKQEGYKIYSVELDDNAIDYRALFGKHEEKVCLVMGNEVQGVAQDILDISDAIVAIPMHGKKVSLNVSVAAGIVMYAVSG